MKITKKFSFYRKSKKGQGKGGKRGRPAAAQVCNRHFSKVTNNQDPEEPKAKRSRVGNKAPEVVQPLKATGSDKRGRSSTEESDTPKRKKQKTDSEEEFIKQYNERLDEMVAPFVDSESVQDKGKGGRTRRTFRPIYADEQDDERCLFFVFHPNMNLSQELQQHLESMLDTSEVKQNSVLVVRSFRRRTLVIKDSIRGGGDLKNRLVVETYRHVLIFHLS